MFQGIRARSLALAVLVASAPALVSLSAVPSEEPPCGIAPRAKPKRIKGGEGVPPLPLPATPLRRTERKRDPSPPLLVGKLRWGRRDLVWKLPDGTERPYGDWSHDPNDIHRLLEALTREIKTKYRAREMDLAGFSFDPAETPILYATGLKAFTLTPDERNLVREYLRRGGFFMAVAHHGSREFSDSVRREASLLFPDRPFGLLPPDHAIYRAHTQVDRITYTKGTQDRPEGAPCIEGLYIGCRVGMVLSPYDLCCTWDSDHLPDSYPGIAGREAFALGVNILSYAIAYYPLGKFYGQWGLVEMEDQDVERGDFVFAQVRHSGHHDPHPAAFASLLKDVMKGTSIGARFRRKVVSLASPELSSCPFLYMTGHDDFRLSDDEREGLRKFLAAGGFLLADSCCGNIAFGLAFRREMARVLPDSKLEVLGASHPVFSSFETIAGVEYTTAVRASFPELKGPFIEGIEIDGSLRVAYSRFDLGNGWDGEDRPFSLGWMPADARRMAVNIILYCMTH